MSTVTEPSLAPKNTLSVFSSIENRNNSFTLEDKSGPLDNNTTRKKRCSISQDTDNKSCAAHRMQRIDALENKITDENSIPARLTIEETAKSTEMPMKKNRGRKRIAPADKALVPLLQQQQHTAKRKKSRQSRKDQQQPSLYQTCTSIWPKSSTLGDYACDNVKSLSNLLKVRLCQAKFKMMAKLDQDNELFSFLSEEYVPPKLKMRQPINLSNKKSSKSTISVVGNGKRLFARSNKPSQESVNTSVVLIDSSLSNSTRPNLITSPEGAKQKDRKKKTSKVSTPKQKRVMAPKRRSAAADAIPVTLSDGSSFYLCEPCNKKYKNRNGLAYHMERCKYSKSKIDESNEKEASDHTENSSQQTVECICSQNTTETAMVQCDACQHWLHSECVDKAGECEDGFTCPKCQDKDSTQSTLGTDNAAEVSEANKVGKDLLQCLLDAQAKDRLESQENSQQTSNQLFSQSNPRFEDELSLQQEQFEQMHEFFIQEPKDIDEVATQEEDETTTQEEDELHSIPTNLDEDEGVQTTDINDFMAQPSSPQLHIWDDFNASFDKASQDHWNSLDDDEPFSNYDTDLPSSSWTGNDLNMFSQPPSLLFSENSMNVMDEATTPLMNDVSISEDPLSTCAPTSTNNDPTPSGTSSDANTLVQGCDGLWFQFANFDDDYQCDEQ